eukprot:6506182-Pyramimonas_sp.AAC.1
MDKVGDSYLPRAPRVQSSSYVLRHRAAILFRASPRSACRPAKWRGCAAIALGVEGGGEE